MKTGFGSSAHEPLDGVFIARRAVQANSRGCLFFQYKIDAAERQGYRREWAASNFTLFTAETRRAQRKRRETLQEF